MCSRLYFTVLNVFIYDIHNRIDYNYTLQDYNTFQYMLMYIFKTEF